MQQNQSLADKIYEKFCVRQWTIGFFYGNIEDIIRNKSFDPDIHWLPVDSYHRFFADPFCLEKNDSGLNVMVEEFDFRKDYGKITLLTLDESFCIAAEKILLDTKSHLSYPFIYRENNKIYVFPEAGKSGKLSCYEYDPVNQILNYVQTIIDLPLIDSTILKLNGKYWIFGTLAGKRARKNLYIFYSDKLMGPYEQHPENPVTDSLNGSRPAGNFIQVDGALFRLAQNCENRYGESIAICKVNRLDEIHYEEEPYMLVENSKNNKLNKGIYTIHTISVMDDIIVVDGEKRTFYPFTKIKYQLIKYFKEFMQFLRVGSGKKGN